MPKRKKSKDNEKEIAFDSTTSTTTISSPSSSSKSKKIETKSKKACPNILITGTPGTGKTTLAAEIGKLTNLKHLNVGEFIKKHKCHENYDKEFDTYILDEDKLLDLMEPLMSDDNQGYIVDYHSCDFFPERWFDLVLVLQTDTSTLYDRLTKRGYNEKKLQENLQCEIMMIVLESAHESYTSEIVQELPSSSKDDMNTNIKRCIDWYEFWKTQEE